jgi:hypothetical protein
MIMMIILNPAGDSDPAGRLGIGRGSYRPHVGDSPGIHPIQAADFPAGPIDLARIRHYELACQRLRVRVGRAGKYTRRGPCSLSGTGTGIRGFRGLPVGGPLAGHEVRLPVTSAPHSVAGCRPGPRVTCSAIMMALGRESEVRLGGASGPERGPPRS